LCDPGAASTCAGSDACNSIVGALSGSTSLMMGYCGPSSKWGQSCATDAPTPTGSAGNCGFTINGRTQSSLYCAPATLLAENPSINVLGICQFTPAASTA